MKLLSYDIYQKISKAYWTWSRIKKICYCHEFLAYFTIAGVTVFSWKRGRIEDISGNVSSTQSFCPFLKNDFHVLQSSVVPGSKHVFAKLIHSSCGCLKKLSVTVDGIVYLLFTGHSLTTFIDQLALLWHSCLVIDGARFLH